MMLLPYNYVTYLAYSILVVVASFGIGYAFRLLQEQQVNIPSLILASIGSTIMVLGLLFYVEKHLSMVKAMISKRSKRSSSGTL